jgi:hypothetical protein
MEFVKILKERGDYLDNQINHVQEKADSENRYIILLSIAGSLILFYGIIIYNLIIIIISVVMLQIAWIMHKNSSKRLHAYRKGVIGEQSIVELLKNLGDEFYLINDIVLQKPYGNIDHVVLGPNGIFVIETKNYGGTIVCNGDEWYRRYRGKYGPKDYPLPSPSKQAKRNAVQLRAFLINNIKNRNIDLKRLFVNCLLVFTGSDIDLDLNNPTVPILKAEELPSFIANFESNNKFSAVDLEFIANSIIDDLD